MEKIVLIKNILLEAVNHPQFAYASWGTLLLTIFVLVFQMYKNKRLKLKELKSKRFFREDVREYTTRNGLKERKQKTSIKVVIKNNKLIFKKYNRKLTTESFWNEKEFFEHIYGKKIVDITSKTKVFGQNEVILFFEQFPKKYTEEDLTIPKVGEFLIGVSGKLENVFQNIKDECILFVNGQKGSGKTNSVNTAIESFFLNPYHRENYQLLLLDYKLNDFLHLKKRKGLDVRIFDTSDNQQFKESIDFLEERVNEWKLFKQIKIKEGLQIQNFLDFKGKKPKHLFIVIDEAKQVLSNRQMKPPGKNASKAEVINFEKYQLEKRLIALIDHIAETHRYLGNVLIIASQASTSGSYGINFTNLKCMLLSRDTKQQSENLTGDPKLLTSRDLHNGRFIYVANGRLEKVQVPFIRTPFKK